MSVVAEFSAPAGAFELGRLLAGDGVRIELERLVPTGNELVPYFWAEVPEGDFEAFERSVRADPLVSGLEVADRVGDERLYAVEWERPPEGLLRCVARTGGVVLEGRSADGHWRFVVRFPEHDGLASFGDLLEDRGVDVEVHRVHGRSREDRRVHGFDLTGEQREALVRAARRGYFEVPRRATLADLADDLGISPQAASERVRRGTDAVLGSVLLGDESSPADGGDHPADGGERLAGGPPDERTDR